MTPSDSPSLYDAYSHPPDRARKSEPDLTIYRDPGEPEFGRFAFEAPADGLVQVDPPHGDETVWSREFEIAYTKWGDRGPLVLFLHGVPTNRAQWEPIQKHVARFCETISIDMLGMGESTQPRLYGRRESGDDVDPGRNEAWYWKSDVAYIEELMQAEYPGREFFFVADDWGSGILSHYAARHPDRLLGLAHLDAIAFDGYPVNEIQAIGRAARIPNTEEGDRTFAQMFADFDQTAVQILKTMVHNPERYNQYNLRWITFPYVDVDYERNAAGDGVTDVATSTTMRLKLHNLRVLAERAAVLSPALLLPYHEEKNPEGVKYGRIDVPSLVMWGEYDKMMPAAQTQRFAYAHGTDDVQITYVPRAGHFAGHDNPGFVADTLVNFIRRVAGREALADVNLGNEGIWKGDERRMIDDLRAIYGIEAASRL